MTISTLNMMGKQTKVPLLFLCALCSFGLISNVAAITNSLVLQQSPIVVIGSQATYICAATGNGVDPTFIWTRRSNGVVSDISNQATVPAGEFNPSDGSAKSQIQFIVDQSFISQEIWCGALDSGRTGPTIEIFATISETGSTVVGLGETCGGSTQCGQFAFCNVQTCQCSNGYYDNNGNANGGTCSIQSTLGSSCPSSIQSACAAFNSFCNSANICACSAGYVRSGLFCIQDTSAGLGASCLNPTRTCVVSNSACNNGFCQCNTGYYQSASSTCIQQSTVGEVCNPAFPSTACSTSGSICDSNTNRCSCSTGFVYLSSDNTCNIPYVGQTCSANLGCRSLSVGVTGTTLSQCVNNVCQCPSSYFSYNNICYIKSGLGNNCNNLVLDSCSASNSQCAGTGNTGICTCNTGYSVNAQGTCVIISGTDYCSAASQLSNTQTGATNPNAPDVTVNKQCYETSLYETVLLNCYDSKKQGPIRDAGWYVLPGYQEIVQSTSRFINGDFSNPNLTISNIQSGDDGFYVCYLCYGLNKTRCTNSTPVEVQVNGTAISSVVTSVSNSAPELGNSVTFTCTTNPTNVATSYEWLRNGVSVNNAASFTIPSIQASDSGTYVCMAGNEFGTVMSSNQQEIDIQFKPMYSLSNGGDTINIFGNLATSSINLTCAMDANPAITLYRFYDSLNRLLGVGSSNQFQVDEALGYGIYRCTAENSIGVSDSLNFDVQLQQVAPSTGASTEDDGVSTGTIAAIVIGIIFLLLLIIIIIICCCNYGWCRKKENIKVEPVIVEQPKVRPYIPRSVVSATSSTVSRRDVGVVVNGHTNVASEVVEEPVYTSPRYYLRPAKDSGPIISMYDNTFDQHRAHQLPALDTQYLYTDEEPKKRHKKRRKRKSHRSYREEEHTVQAPPQVEDEDLVVIPGGRNQNYYE